MVIVLGIIRGKAGDDLQDLEGDFLQSYVLDKKGYNEKCPLTMLEMSIKYYEKKNPALMRLKDLKKLYPGDKFSDIVETNDCHNDEETEEVCEKLASEGHCTGENTAVS